MVLPEDIKLIIFDFDGTLFYMDVDWTTLNEQLSKCFGQNTLTNINKLDTAEKEAAIAMIREAELTGIKKGIPAPGALKILNSLGANHSLAINSRNTREAVVAGLEKIGYTADILITAKQDVKESKPHPESIQLILQLMHFTPSQAVLVGDTYHDIAAAKAAGLISIAIHNPKLTFSPQGADAYVENLEELVSARPVT